MALDLLVVPGDEFGCPGYVRLAYCVPKTMLERSLPASASSPTNTASKISGWLRDVAHF